MLHFYAGTQNSPLEYCPAGQTPALPFAIAMSASIWSGPILGNLLTVKINFEYILRKETCRSHALPVVSEGRHLLSESFFMCADTYTNKKNSCFDAEKRKRCSLPEQSLSFVFALWSTYFSLSQHKVIVPRRGLPFRREFSPPFSSSPSNTSTRLSTYCLSRSTPRRAGP